MSDIPARKAPGSAGVRVLPGGGRQPHEPAAATVVRLPRDLTVRTAHAFCRTVAAEIPGGGRALTLEGSDVARVDAVGLSALLQSARVAEQRHVPCVVQTNHLLHHAMIEAQVIDDVPTTPRITPAVTGAADDAPTVVLARAAPLTVRTPESADLPLFETWARDPFLDQMVGSDLLYRCRHLGAADPHVGDSVLADVTSITALVEVENQAGPPLGFTRLYDIRLIEGLAFLEVVIADHRALRRGWGIFAARLLIAWAHDALGIRRIEAKAYAYNAPSINALRRNGFQQEGVLREARLFDGQYWDILVFAMLDREMQQQRAQETFPYMGFWDAA